MQVNNKLVEKSFRYTSYKANMSLRLTEIEQLSDIYHYCKNINEKITYDDKIWDIEVEKDIDLTEWLYSGGGTGSVDDRRLISEILEKQGTQNPAHTDISISLGKWKKAVASVDEYVRERRRLLAQINSPEEYYDFMKSCFTESYFADDILREMKHIRNFSDHAKEITDNLAVLNDEAIDLYCKYHDNLKNAVDELSSKLLACSMDPKHRDSLWFSFTYEDLHTDIRCEPHMKLIREDSDLRIYFYWKDNKIAEGKKVLIGRIGRHPWT